jgi:hypothetical protein
VRGLFLVDSLASIASAILLLALLGRQLKKSGLRDASEMAMQTE